MESLFFIADIIDEELSIKGTGIDEVHRRRKLLVDIISHCVWCGEIERI